MSAREKITHIIQTHHEYLRREVPVLTEKIRRAVETHPQDDRWSQLEKAFSDLKASEMTHILKEEVMLFPSICHMEDSVQSKTRPDLKKHDLRESLEQAELEHESTVFALTELDAAMRKIVWEGEVKEIHEELIRLRDDLREHMRKEDEELFPEARFLYAKATEGLLREE